MYFKRNLQLESNYNQRARNLAPLGVGSNVRVQNKGKWDRTGLIVETLPNRQYRVKLNGSGRITLRNRRFLKLESLNTGDAVVNPDSRSSGGSPNLVSDSSAVTSLSLAVTLSCPYFCCSTPAPAPGSGDENSRAPLQL